jgi:hypothetical protein
VLIKKLLNQPAWIMAVTSLDLTAFWIKTPFPNGPLGFGVTAWSFEDALAIISALGYERYLPDELAELLVTEGVTVAELDQQHVARNMGPIVVRGMWYPFVAVGVPRWADEGRTRLQP